MNIILFFRDISHDTIEQKYSLSFDAPRKMQWTLFLACTVTQYKNKSTTIKWTKSGNWDAIGDW